MYSVEGFMTVNLPTTRAYSLFYARIGEQAKGKATDVIKWYTVHPSANKHSRIFEEITCTVCINWYNNVPSDRDPIAYFTPKNFWTLNIAGEW